jgi:hypothetical protein
VSPSSPIVVTSASDGSCVVWEYADKNKTFLLRKRCILADAMFRGAAIHADSQVVTVTSDRKTIWWDMGDGAALRVLEGAAVENTVAISPSGNVKHQRR